MGYIGWTLDVELTCISGIISWSGNTILKILCFGFVDILLRIISYLYLKGTLYYM